MRARQGCAAPAMNAAPSPVSLALLTRPLPQVNPYGGLTAPAATSQPPAVNTFGGVPPGEPALPEPATWARACHQVDLLWL